MRQSKAMSLLELTNELLLLIADHLPMTGVSGLRRTCRRIYRVLKRLNRKRIVMDDVMSLADLEDAMLSPRSRNRLRCATALEISAITVLPPLPPRTRLTLSSFLSSIAPNVIYFSLYLVPECDISYIPPHPPGSPIHPCLTHLSIVNFRVPSSFLTSLPFLVEATIVLLVTPIQNEVGQLQYRPSEVQTLLLALPATTLKRLTITCTSLPPDILALAAQRFTSLTHLSFAWVDAPDRLSSGVDSTDITGSLHQYVNAIAPLAGTLQALYLPACVGIQSTSKGPIKALPSDDELLGEGPVLVPILDQTHGRPMIPHRQSSPGWNGIHQPKPGRVSVGMKTLLNACKTLVRDSGNGGQGKGDGMYLLEKIGWLIPQGDDLPLLPIECLRRRGVVTFGGSTNGTTKPRKPRSVSNASMVLSSLTSLSLSSTYSPNTHVPRSVPITYDGAVQYGTGFGTLSNGIDYGSNGRLNGHTAARSHREESEYWYPSMDWGEGCAWPAFTEIDGVFPRPEFLRY